MFEITLLYHFKKYLYNVSKLNGFSLRYNIYRIQQEAASKGGKSSQKIIKCHSGVFKNAEVLTLCFNGSSAAS